MTKSLLEILDASIFPAALMIAAKFIGLYITVELFALEWGVENSPNSFFSTRPVLYSSDVALVSTNSDLLLLFIMLAGLSFYIIRATFFHASHIDPKMLSRLAINGLLGIVSSSYEVYRKATVWLIFVWVTNFTILINALNNKTESWVPVIGIIATLFLSVILLRDVIYEVKLSRENIGQTHK
ncbi:hypothetical protein JW978_03225 [Candidatus Dojkabacteria bacterium]|nr:hypothetical protein [Candidatus Dojkabacteria bacterium]